MLARRAMIVPLLALGPAVTACGGPSPTTVKVTVVASPQTNPNSDNQPSPTVVRLYDLKTPDTFNNASFFDLYNNDSRTLGADMLGRREIEIPPGQTLKVDGVAATGTQYLGVMAGFRDLTGSGWRTTYKLDTGDTNKLIVTLEAKSLTLSKPSSGFLGIF
jgi:type VI secretion system protein VasD